MQRDLPPFIGKPGISTESFFLLLIHFLTSFFHSPYLITCGDRLSSAVALTHNLLQTIRDLCSSSSSLPFEFSVSVWCDLIRSLADGIRTVSSRLIIDCSLWFIVFLDYSFFFIHLLYIFYFFLDQMHLDEQHLDFWCKIFSLLLSMFRPLGVLLF